MFYLLLLGTGLPKLHVIIILAIALRDGKHHWCLALPQKGMYLEIVTLLRIMQSKLPTYYQWMYNVSNLGVKVISTI